MAQSNNILNDSLTSSGSALKEYNVYLDSLEGKIQGFKTAFEAMSSTLADDDFLKVTVDIGTELLNVLTEIIKKLGGVPTLLSMIAGGYASVKNIGLFKTFETDTNKLSDKIGILGKSFKTISSEVEESLEGVEGRFKRFGTRISSFFKSAFSNPVITQSDSIALQQYADALLDGKENNEEITQAMDGVSQSAKDQAKKIQELHKQFKNHEITQEQYIERSELATQSTQKLSFAQKAATVTSKALKAALDTIIVIAVVQAVLTIIQKLVEFVNSYSSSIDAIKDKSQELENVKSNIESVNDELATVKQRLAELNSIKTPTLIEQEEIDKLEKTNAELERRLKLLKYKEKTTTTELNAQAQAAWEDLSVSSVDKTRAAVAQWESKSAESRNPLDGYDAVLKAFMWELLNGFKDTFDTFNNNDQKARDNYLADYVSAILDRGILNYDYDSGQITDEKYNSEFERLSKEIEERQSQITKWADEYNTLLDNLDPNDHRNNEAIERITAYLNKFDYWFDYSMGKGDKSFVETLNSADYAVVVTELKRLAKQGTLTVESFKNTDGIDSFISAISELSYVVGEDGVLDDSDIQKVIDSIAQISSTSDDGADSIDPLTDSLANFKDTYDKVFSTQSTIQSAFDKIQEGSSLSADEVRKLVELCKDSYPEIATAFTKTADGYTISANDIISANKAITKSTKEEIQNQINEYQNIVDAYNDKKLSPPTINSYIDYQNYQNYSSELSNLAIEADKAQSAIDALSLVMGMFDLTTNNTVDKVKELSDKYNELFNSTSKLVGKAKTVSSAFAEQNENGSLSTETVLSLIENGYAAALMYDKTTGAIRLNAQAYLDLAKAEIESQIIELKIAKETALQEKLNAEREIVSNLGWSYLGAAKSALEFARVEAVINKTTSDVSNYDSQIKALEDYQNKLGDIINGNYGNTSGSTEDLNKKLFEQEKALRQHWLAMGKDDTGKKYTEEMYYAWLDSADGYKKYFSDLKKYLDENRQYEEEVYKWKLERDKQFFQERLDNYNKLVDTELNDKEYDDPLQKYREAAAVIKDAIAATQNRINDLVASGSSAVQDEIDDLTDTLGDLNEKLAEINDNLWDTRVDNEQEFWEQQKEAVQSYYDNEIKKLQDIEDEQEKINKQEELRLNLIKAQQELLDAKKNRNQLVFHNGTFEYMYDQENVESALENLKNAQNDIAKNQRQESIKLLEEQRDNALEFYDKILNIIEAYINKTLPVEASDPEVLGEILNSKYAKTANQETTINNPTSDIKNATKDFKTITLDDVMSRLGVTKAQFDKFSESMDIVSGIFNMRNPNLLEKAVTNNSYVNSNSNQSNVSVGDIYVTVQGGTSDTMINEFAEKLRSKLVTLGVRTQVN